MDLVHRHILSRGFLPGYTTWTFHGEQRVGSRYQASQTLSQSTSASGTVIAGDDMSGLLRDALGYNLFTLNDESEVREEDMSGTNEVDGSRRPDSSISFCIPHQQNGDIGDEDARHKKLLEQCDKELYPGCKYSNLSFNLHLYHLKCFGWDVQ